jgi:hypothetical protein
LAAQVLSKSVADAFSYYNDPATTETEAFIRRMDRLFDCLNVRNHSEWQQKRKEDLKPYTSPDDSRLKWLKEDFLLYLDHWEASVCGQTADEKKKKMLSSETLEGLRITVNSFVEMTKYLLSAHDDLYLLSERFSQDCLELLW